jgi:hypothetical protein
MVATEIEINVDNAEVQKALLNGPALRQLARDLRAESEQLRKKNAAVNEAAAAVALRFYELNVHLQDIAWFNSYDE